MTNERGRGQTYGFDPAVFLDILDHEGVSGPVHQTEKSLVFDCPVCGHSKKLYVRKSDGKFVCWYCAKINHMEGSAPVLLGRLLGVSFQQAETLLYGEDRIVQSKYLELPWADESEDDILDRAVLSVVSWPWDCLPLGAAGTERGIQYLEGRGISVEVAQHYGVRYSAVERRVYFPVQARGQLYGWQARTIVGAEPKILSSTDIPRHHTVMFQDRLSGVSHCLLAEGPVDAIKAHLVGGNVATMGKVVSQGQIDLIRNAGIRTVYLALDPDAANEMERLVKSLQDLDVRLVEIPRPYKDLGEMSLADARDAIMMARPVRPWRLFVYLGG